LRPDISCVVVSTSSTSSKGWRAMAPEVPYRL
jgi:hypothetical protein